MNGFYRPIYDQFPVLDFFMAKLLDFLFWKSKKSQFIYFQESRLLALFLRSCSLRSIDQFNLS